MSTSVYTGLNPFNFIRKHFLHTLPVLNFNSSLTTVYSETTAHFNGNVDTDNQIYVTWPKCTATFRTHCTSGWKNHIVLYSWRNNPRSVIVWWNNFFCTAIWNSRVHYFLRDLKVLFSFPYAFVSQLYWADDKCFNRKWFSLRSTVYTSSEVVDDGSDISFEEATGEEGTTLCTQNYLVLWGP
jgi:hypothetical protein